MSTASESKASKPKRKSKAKNAAAAEKAAESGKEAKADDSPLAALFPSKSSCRYTKQYWYAERSAALVSVIIVS